MNIGSYSGIPYNFRTYNCWHHVVAVRKAAGIDTPPFDVQSPVNANATFEDAHSNPKGLTQVDEPQNFDAVLFAERVGSRLVWHSGLYFDGMISHCERQAKQVRLEYFIHMKRRYERIEFWR